MKIFILLSLVAAVAANASDERFLQTGGIGKIEEPVLVVDVVAQCKGDKIFDECGTACPLTCDNVGEEEVACTQLCVQGCFCPKKGSTIASGDACVEPESCPAAKDVATDVCTGGKIFNECGTACPLTCENVGEDVLCTQQCVQGCFCPTGTIASGDACVEPASCTCANTLCSADKTCIESADGPQCVGGTGAWFDVVKENYTGDMRLKKCTKRQDGRRPAPKDGDKCSKKPKACFFGNQACGGLPYPDTLCECVNKKWSCDEALACPAASP
jgi:hypothetical protein